MGKARHACEALRGTGRESGLCRQHWRAVSLRRRGGSMNKALRLYGEVIDSVGNHVDVQASSAAGEPAVWLRTHDADGRRGYIGPEGKPYAATPHLTKPQALALICVLQRFVDDSA